MRKSVAMVVGLAFAGLVACDDSGNLAGLSGFDGSDNAALTVLPTDVQITVGSTTQLSTNAGTSTQLQWRSSDNNVATVSSTGLVTGRGVGTATVTVRFSTDTTNAATSSVSVTQ
jgi:hypothetical protein